MNPRQPLRSGIFLAPFHPVNEDPTLAIRRDIQLVEWLDELGYEEAWIGEHHSAGFEIIASDGSRPGPTPNSTRPRVWWSSWMMRFAVVSGL